LTWGKERNKLGSCRDKRGGAEVGIHGGVSGVVSGDDDILDEPNGETGGDDEVGCMGHIICIYPYAPSCSLQSIFSALSISRYLPWHKNHTPPLIKYDLPTAVKCNTLLDMKSATLTIRLDKDLDVLLSKASKKSGRNRSEIAREALRRQLRLQQFEELRKRIMPFAEARGFLTDEDIFSQIS